MKTMVKILCWVLAVALLASGIAVILAFTNGGNEEFKTFYIERDGKKILASETEDVFDAGETVEYRVKYTFDVGQETKRDYIVKVIPNEAEDFAYTVDGVSMAWKRAGELSGATLFGLVKEADRFLLSFGTDYQNGMEDVMAKLYPGQSVVLPEAFDDTKPYFTLYVASYNEAVQFRINFSVSYTGEYTIAAEPADRDSDMLWYSYAKPNFVCAWSSAAAGTKVGFTVELDSAYEVVGVTATDGHGTEIAEVTRTRNVVPVYEGYFIMPKHNVVLLIEIRART